MRGFLLDVATFTSIPAEPEAAVTLVLAGDWLLESTLPAVDALSQVLEQQPRPARVSFDAQGLGRWDSGLVTRLVALHSSATARGVAVDYSGLPEGAGRLVNLAFAVKEREGARRIAKKTPFLAVVGLWAIALGKDLKELMTFTGELALSLGRMLRGRATYQRAELMQHIQEAGAEALPIVSLISFLIGMIFAFVGVVQLNLFGAGIYTANLVAVAMVREMSAIMTGIIMAGRTGAAYAAQIGTMKVNEEVDALTTLGINPIDSLVTPRVVAMVIMMPLLTLYASVMGILGGMTVGMAMLDVSLVQYLAQTVESVTLNALFGGLFKSLVYGSLVALAGCQQGIACGNSAMAVGQSTTQAVVRGIVMIVISASVLTVIYINLGI